MLRIIYILLLTIICSNQVYSQNKLDSIILKQQEPYLKNSKVVSSKVTLSASVDIQNDTLYWKLTIQNNNNFDLWFLKPFFPKGYTTNYINAILYDSQEATSSLRYMLFLDNKQTIALPDIIDTFFIDSSNSLLIAGKSKKTIFINNPLINSNLVGLHGTFTSKIVLDYDELIFLSKDKKNVYKGRIESNSFEVKL